MSRAASIRLGGLDLLPDLAGALHIPEFDALLVADLHLEKASSLARRGVHLPPYDTRATLGHLSFSLSRSQPKRLILLGDSFHDAEAHLRIDPSDIAELVRLTRGIDIIWLAGNHDPAPPRPLGGHYADEIVLGPITLRHMPGALAGGDLEIAGHLHPSASLAQRGRSLRRKCFVGHERRLVMPAYGSFTGSLSVSAAPFQAIFPDGDFSVWMIGGKAIHRFPSARIR
ncbi:MAG: ligase-associated DNA damage response endonuclease PdeM [Parvibaculaceae bacterium]